MPLPQVVTLRRSEPGLEKSLEYYRSIGKNVTVQEQGDNVIVRYEPLSRAEMMQRRQETRARRITERVTRRSHLSFQVTEKLRHVRENVGSREALREVPPPQQANDESQSLIQSVATVSDQPEEEVAPPLGEFGRVLDV